MSKDDELICWALSKVLGRTIRPGFIVVNDEEAKKLIKAGWLPLDYLSKNDKATEQ